MPTTLTDITHVLDHVHGGNRAKAIVAGAKAAYKAVRPWISKGADVVDTIGKYVGGAVVAKETWDHFRGDDQKPQAPQP